MSDLKDQNEQAPISVEGGLRTKAEQEEGGRNRDCFEHNRESWETKIENFPKYVRRQNITRFLALYEIFKKTLRVKGSIIECGVFRGFGLMSWTKFSSIMEPTNLTRRVYGFDSFAGFPVVGEKDHASEKRHVKEGDLCTDSYDELEELISIHDSTRFLGHIRKASLVRGDASATIPKFIEENPHLIVSLLFMDFDLHEPTKVALEHFVPRMPKGAVIAFDELDNPLWPGESLAMLEHFRNAPLKLERVEFDPYIGFAVLE